MPLIVDTHANANFIDGVETDYNEFRYASVPEFIVRGQLDDSQIKEVLVKGVEDLTLKYDLDGIISLDKLNAEGNAIFGKVEPKDDFATTDDKSLCYWNSGFKETPPVEEGTYDLRIPESAQTLKYSSKSGAVEGQISFLLSHMIISSGMDNFQTYGDFQRDEEGNILLPHGEWLVISSSFESRIEYKNGQPDRVRPEVQPNKINLFGYEISSQRTVINIDKRVEFRYTGLDGIMLVLMRLGL